VDPKKLETKSSNNLLIADTHHLQTTQGIMELLQEGSTDLIMVPSAWCSKLTQCSTSYSMTNHHLEDYLTGKITAGL
jgi:hypothetical protein